MRWPEHMWLLASTGEIVRGRCKATNLCDYCAIQAAHENARMLSLDAIDNAAPEVVAILGTRTATYDPKPFYKGRERVMEALRERFGRQVEYASQCEFTTGKGRNAGGRRRPHWNILLKGVPLDELDQAREMVRDVWCRYVDAEPEAQYVEALQSTAAFMRYVAMHFQKESQAPPPGWKGQRFNCSRGYFGDRTRAQMREAAHESLMLERELWKAQQAGADDVEAAAEQAMELRAATTWRLWTQSYRQPVVHRDDPQQDHEEILHAGPTNPPVAHGAAEPRRGLTALGSPGP